MPGIIRLTHQVQSQRCAFARMQIALHYLPRQLPRPSSVNLGPVVLV